MTSSSDSLRELIDDEAASINRDRLLTLLKPYVRFNSSGSLNFLPQFGKLDGRAKVQIILAASKARSLLMPDKYPDGLIPKEILDLETMPVGTGKSAIKDLSDTHKIRKDETSGRYIIPNFLIDELADRLASNSKKHE